MTKIAVCMSDEWETPDELFAELDREFHFTLDVCANYDNAKCNEYFSTITNALCVPWLEHICWMNPPYSELRHGKWTRKAYEESKKGATVVCLLPASVGARWWANTVVDKADEIRFITGRVKFKGAQWPAKFDSAIVVFRRHEGATKIKWIRR